jgi:hypothetical protein
MDCEDPDGRQGRASGAPWDRIASDWDRSADEQGSMTSARRAFRELR